MRTASLCLAFVAAAISGCASVSGGPDAATAREIAPTGKLRVGVAAAPSRSALFVVRGADGEPSGVTADLGRDFARRLGVPHEFTVVSNSGELVDRTAAGELDLTFAPVDAERRKKVDFGPDYVVFESTYLVRPGSSIGSIEEIDRSGVRVVAVANTATFRTLAKLLKSATLSTTKSVDEAVQLLGSGKADAFALGRPALPPLAARLPGSRILDGRFQRSSIAVAVPKNRAKALAFASEWMEEAKTSGVVRRALDDAGLKDLEVALPSPRR